MQNKTGPFLRTPLTVENIMFDVLISLVPATIAGIIFFGWRALIIVLLSTLSAILTEALLLRAPFTVQGILGDGSAAVTGLLLGLILPSTSAWWVPILGSILAIALIKLAFGGLGYNIFNPALGARAILLLAFTSQLVKFTVPFDTITAATPLLSSRSFSWALVWGNVGGSIGETSVIAILLGGVYLLYKGHINWRIPVGYVGSAFVLALIWGLDPWFSITAGGIIFAAVFMATDMVTSPVTSFGQVLFGIGCGVLTMVIRQFTPLPEGVTFAVLTMNALAPVLENVTVPTIFGVDFSQDARYKGVAIGTALVVILVGGFIAIDRLQPSVVPVISHGQHLPIAEVLGTQEYEAVEENGTLYYLTRDEEGNPARVAFVAEQGGFNAPIRFFLVLNEDHAIETVQILEHQEDPGLGDLITRPNFLNQFTGLDETGNFSLGGDIEGITGATISSRALSSGVNKALENFQAAFYPEEDLGAWLDGVYLASVDSFGGPMDLEVEVSAGQISAVKVLKHSDTPGLSDPAINSIPGAIVAANSAKVDAASGATVTSEAIMKGVQVALEQAQDGQSSVSSGTGFKTNVADGTYQGSANGFGGNLVLDVTVSNGAISEITVVSSGETAFIADPAFKTLFPAIIEAQGPVDAVSGATVTSEAVFKAVENALSASTGIDATSTSETYAINVADGSYESTVKGFGGDLVLAITVADGKLSEIEVVSSQETAFIADPAFRKLFPALIEAQAPVEVVSGATITSKAVLQAVEAALSGSNGVEEVASATVEPYAINVDDGRYENTVKGFGGDLVLAITVTDGKLTEIEVVSSQETAFIADPAFKQLFPALIEEQAPVEVVSGATITSKAVLQAVEAALSGSNGVEEVASATVEPYAINVDDGRYENTVKGFGGDLVLAITVADGKLSEIEVVSSQETPFIADPAFKSLFPALVEAQAPVEVVSGATVTSKAVLQAVEAALSGSSEVEEVASVTVEPYAINVDDGRYENTVKGFGGDLVLAITVADGNLSEIEVVSSQETPFIADPAFKSLFPALVEAQAPVEVVSGATITSKAVLEAVETALSGSSEVEEAASVTVEPYNITLADGTYRGTATGFGGDLVLDVTISDGKLSEIEVVSSEETAFIADPAFKSLFPALIEAQSPVETVSGATITSKAVHEAILDALSVEGDQ